MATVPSGTSHILRPTRGKLCKLAADLADHVHNTEKETPMYSLLLVDDEEFALGGLRLYGHPHRLLLPGRLGAFDNRAD